MISITVGITLLLFMVIGIYLMKHDWEFSGASLSGIGTLGLIFHITLISLRAYNYEQFITQRTSFEQTLQESRINGSELESASIAKDVAEWNRILASTQYDSKTFFLSQYIDKRFDTLEPIK